MAAPLELSCWGGGWGLPSVHSESLVVMAYAKFSGAPLKVNFIDNTWRGSRGDVPILTTEDNTVSQPAKILNFLRKQKYNADYELSAKQGADTLAYIALLEEKLLPAVLHTFWVESDNYFTVTKPWFASRIPFPLSLILPGRMSRGALNRILLTKGEPPLYRVQEVEAQIYRDAKECLNLLSNRLGTSQFFFGDTPSTLDAYVFGFLAPLYKVRFPKVQLQEHLKQLSNLCRFCDDILNSYFRLNLGGKLFLLHLIFVCIEYGHIFLGVHKQSFFLILIKKKCTLSINTGLHTSRSSIFPISFPSQNREIGIYFVFLMISYISCLFKCYPLKW
ncbi:metaxin 3, transcript variant X1 [Ictidomys tridecemlineatus]|uniref:metaxin-3 isoform X1 n=1 Tax=Ictidomys tridecemlineatus TaxID=43179 RepID=UPI000B544103|nr:metaxin-3 isoform X1 [Ictidomys tridecemlineatus]KAG3266439.1 metaxin 3, transcript variant X1 [Ictidomys tridecemlineatus]